MINNHWLVVSKMTGLFSISYAGDVILPIDELIFFKMVETTNQMMYWIYPNRLFVICLAAPAKSEMKRFQKTSNALVSLPNETWKTGIWWVDTTTLGRNMNKHEILKMLHLLLSLWILGLVGLRKWIQYKWIPMEDKWCCTLAWLRNRCPRHSREKSKQMQAGLNGCLSFWKIQVPYGLATG